MAKVCKSDGEGTLAGKRGNDKVAPRAVVPGPPKATFVTRLRPFRSPGRAARQLPDLSTILWVDSSSTGDSRLRGALPIADIRRPPLTSAVEPSHSASLGMAPEPKLTFMAAPVDRRGGLLNQSPRRLGMSAGS